LEVLPDGWLDLWLGRVGAPLKTLLAANGKFPRRRLTYRRARQFANAYMFWIEITTGSFALEQQQKRWSNG